MNTNKDTSIEINDGHQQINPAATQAIQNNYYGHPVPSATLTPARTVVILGAGADASVGFPTSSALIPGIVDWLETEEGRAVDEALRKLIKRLTFRFDKFVEEAIDRLAKELDRERVSICRQVDTEMRHNERLTDDQRKMGNLIVRTFQKITDIKQGAAIDEETEALIREVTGLEPTDPTLIDFGKLNYTDTFKNVIVHILRQSLHESGHPILRHVYRNLLDIERLLARYFYGFFTDRPGQKKSYLYIAWVLWAFLIHCEQELKLSQNTKWVYEQLRGREEIQVVTFNYTTLAAEVSPSALYYNGNLTDYVDIENRNDLRVDDIHDLDLVAFFRDRLPGEMSLEGDRVAIPVPTFLPPLKLKPVISDRYITTWYRTLEVIRQAERILILGHSLHVADHSFCDMLRNNRRAEITLIDRDVDTVCRRLCDVLQLSVDRYTPMTIQGHPARKYDNRITLVEADLNDIDLTPWLEQEENTLKK